MALKQNIEYVKESLNSQEQFLGNLIKGEKFLKKNKITIIAIVILFLIYILFNYASNHSKAHNLKVSNEAYIQLMQNPNDEKLLEVLKNSNLNLYSLFMFHNVGDEEVLKNLIDEPKLDPILSDFFEFDVNLKSKDGFMDDYVNLIEGFKFLKNNDIEQAKTSFLKIPLSSDLFEISNSYMHLVSGSEKWNKFPFTLLLF